MRSKTFISRSGREFNSRILKEELDWASNLEWSEQAWKPKPALVEKSRGTIYLYTGQTYDTTKIELVEDGWTHDQCDICRSQIRENDSCAVSDGHYICSVCYSDFIVKTS